MHKRVLTEKLKFPEELRIPVLGGWSYRFLCWLDNRLIVKEKIPRQPLNTQERDEYIICSLTSYPARINQVHLAIKSLLLQTYKPDRVVLYLAEEQFPLKNLPESLVALKEYGLEIVWMKDMYGHKKYFFPGLNQKENELIITFDDDIIYSPLAIERLIKTHHRFPHALVCERAQVFDGSDALNPGKWKVYSSLGVDSPIYGMNPSPGGGCLIPYGAFYQDALDESKFRSLAYKNDDLWYMFMTAQNECPIVKTRRGTKAFSTICGSQGDQMAIENVVNNGNEPILLQLINAYPEAWTRLMKRRICFVTAVAISANAFLRNHFDGLRESFDLTYISGEKDRRKIIAPIDHYHSIDISRGISLLHDIKAMFQLILIFRRERFDAVHSVTPKAGLLTACASFIAGIPVRIHIFTGQVWANKKGLTRAILKMMDNIIARLDNYILVDGEGQRRFLIENGVLKEDKSQVLGKGSICGVDLDRFSPSDSIRVDVRKELSINEDQVVFAFMGRLNKDKGMMDLLPAFDRLAGEDRRAYLLLIGDDEENIASSFSDYSHIIPQTNFCYYGQTGSPERILQTADVFVLPTYREGFGSSVIEASALGLPVICSDVYGVMDAMVDDVTGLRFHVGDVDALYRCMTRLLNDATLRRHLGTAGRMRVEHDFDGKYVTDLWLDFYNRILK